MCDEALPRCALQRTRAADFSGGSLLPFWRCPGRLSPIDILCLGRQPRGTSSATISPFGNGSSRKLDTDAVRLGASISNSTNHAVAPVGVQSQASFTTRRDHMPPLGIIGAARGFDVDDGRALLRQILIDEGPLRFVDLRARATRHLHGKSPHSIGPILLTSGEFVRALPGIYAVPEQIPSAATVLSDPPKFFLAEEQVRYLAESRYAGEPFGRFPMWTPETEYALCRWAQGHAHPLLFQSLLFIASIDLWSVSADERAHWSNLRHAHGRYCLSVPPRYPIRQLWPPLDRLLAACTLARQNDGLSWITANRVLKRRLDAHVSPGLLALMVSLGALHAPSQWQMFHKSGPQLAQIVDFLSARLHQTGELNWDCEAGNELLEPLGAAKPAGWVDGNVIREIIAAAEERSDLSLRDISEMDESTSSLEDLLREVGQSQEAGAANQTMRALLAGGR